MTGDSRRARGGLEGDVREEGEEGETDRRSEQQRQGPSKGSEGAWADPRDATPTRGRRRRGEGKEKSRSHSRLLPVVRKERELRELEGLTFFELGLQLLCIQLVNVRIAPHTELGEDTIQQHSTMRLQDDQGLREQRQGQREYGTSKKTLSSNWKEGKRTSSANLSDLLKGRRRRSRRGSGRERTREGSWEKRWSFCWAKKWLR